MMAENQPAPLTPAPPGMVSLGVNADGEEVMTVIGGDGGAGFSGGHANIVPGSGSILADQRKKTLSRLPAECSAAIEATAKWSTENLEKRWRRRRKESVPLRQLSSQQRHPLTDSCSS